MTCTPCLIFCYHIIFVRKCQPPYGCRHTEERALLYFFLHINAADGKAALLVEAYRVIVLGVDT